MESPARPLTVLIVSNHADIVGGGEISLLTLLKGLDRSAWSPQVVVPAEGEIANRCRGLGLPVHVIPLPELKRPGPALLRSLSAMMRLARDTRAVLLHGNGSRAMFYAGITGRLLGRPVIWHLRIWRPDRRLDWLLARLATRTIAISQVVRARLRPWPKAYHRCVVVPNGLDLEEFRPQKKPDEVRESLGIPEGARVIGSVGRLFAFKGYRDLLDAFSQLRRHYQDLWLLIVGGGPEHASLTARARDLGITDRVVFTGHRADIPDLLSAMEVFILPSEAEEFGRVLLEAMAIERPVVATAAGGVPEVVEEQVTGLLVRPGDPAALADAVRSLLTNPARAKTMGSAGRKRVERQFNLRLHAHRVEAVYNEAMGAAD